MPRRWLQDLHDDVERKRDELQRDAEERKAEHERFLSLLPQFLEILYQQLRDALDEHNARMGPGRPWVRVAEYSPASAFCARHDNGAELTVTADQETKNLVVERAMPDGGVERQRMPLLVSGSAIRLAVRGGESADEAEREILEPFLRILMGVAPAGSKPA